MKTGNKLERQVAEKQQWFIRVVRDRDFQSEDITWPRLWEEVLTEKKDKWRGRGVTV